MITVVIPLRSGTLVIVRVTGIDAGSSMLRGGTAPKAEVEVGLLDGKTLM